jgi:hypothetical protein
VEDLTMAHTPTTPRRMVAWQGFAYVNEDGTENWVREGQTFDATDEAPRLHPHNFCDERTPSGERPNAIDWARGV